MRQRMLVGAVAWMIVPLLNGCGKPSETQGSLGVKTETRAARTTSWQKAGVAFRAKWTWASSANGTAQVTLTITPTINAQSMRVQARFPAGVSLVNGEPNRLLATPSANSPIMLAFDVAFPSDQKPMIPVEVLMVVGEEHQYAATIPVCDPDTQMANPVEKPGTTTDIGGFPARIGGEAQPPKR